MGKKKMVLERNNKRNLCKTLNWVYASKNEKEMGKKYGLARNDRKNLMLVKNKKVRKEFVL